MKEANVESDSNNQIIIEFPELGNILYILQHPVATKYFKIYLARNLTLNSYSLWSEVKEAITNRLKGLKTFVL